MAFSNHDIVFDSPTNNFATLNANNKPTIATLSNGNLNFTGGTSNNGNTTATLEVSSGKYYCEMVPTTSYTAIGVTASSTLIRTNYSNNGGLLNTISTYQFQYDGNVVNSSGVVTTFVSYTTSDIIGVLLDMDNRQVSWYKNGTIIGTISGLLDLNHTFFAADSTGSASGSSILNFGQDPTFDGNKVPTKVYTDANGIGRFFHEPPTGALALCTANLAAATTAPTEYIVDETNQHLLTYNGNVTQSKFTPYATDGYSAWFTSDIASSQLRVPTDTNLEFGTDDFTVEFWMYHHGGGDYETIISYPQWRGNDNADGTAWQIRLEPGNNLATDYGNGSAWIYNGSHTDLVIKSGYWNHVVLQRNGGDIKLYLNGIASSSIYTIGSGSIQSSSSFNTNFLCIGGYEQTEQDLGANLADIRIVKGSAVYTEDGNGNITPPSEPLTNITNTQFLLSTSSNRFVDSSSNDYTITTNGSPEISDWSPYTPEAVRTGYEYRNPDEHGGGSFYFDGTNNLKTIDSTDWNPEAQDFTVEGWYYLTETGNFYFMWGTGGSDGNEDIALRVNTNNTILAYLRDPAGTSIGLSSTNTVSKNSWNHIALERYNDVIKIYLNGVAETNTFDATSWSGYNSETGMTIGAFGDYSSGYWKGYIADLRFVKGSAVYQGNFTPPTAKLSTVTNTKFLLQPYKSKITKDILNYASDETGKALTYVGNASVVNTSPYKDGVLGGFNFYNSSSSHDYLKLSSSNDWTPGANSPFTIEFWYKTSVSIGTNNPIMTTAGWSSNFLNRWQIQTNSDKIAFWRSDGNGNLFVGATVLATNKWYHVAVVQDSSSVWKMYLNGIQDATGTDSGFTTDSYLEIGANSTLTGGNGVKGQISDIRIVKGQALYTADFTPPAYPLSSAYYTTNGQDPSDSNSTRTAISGDVSLLAQPGRFIENTAEADNTDNFKTVLYTGNGGTQSITSVGFQPDFVWSKSMSHGDSHALIDAVRGGDKSLYSNAIVAENTYAADTATITFGSDGFSFTEGGLINNRPGGNFVAWCWKAGGAPSGGFTGTEAMVDGSQTTCSALATSAGASITPTAMSVNTKAGFSIVKYTGTGSTGGTVPHGLNKKPDMVIVKNLNDGTKSWNITSFITTPSTDLTTNTFNIGSKTGGVLALNTDVGAAAYTIDGQTSGNGENHIAYCWHSVEGYSKFGSYTGNGSADGPFVYCGFRPAFLIIKNSNLSGSHWLLYDNQRSNYNVVNKILFPASSAEENGEGTAGMDDVDFLSNGFKIRGNPAGTWQNGTNDKLIFMAFAEQPFIYSNAR